MIQAKTVDGLVVHLTEEEVKRLADHYWEHSGKTATHYAEKTHQIMLDAQSELREATGDFPEDRNELFEFAVKHKLFGDREDTHIMCNFLKVFYALMQRETHILK